MEKKLALSLPLAALIALSNPVQAVYIGDDSGKLWDLDPLTNTKTLIGDSGVVMFDIALDPTTGVLYGASENEKFYRIDKTDASVTLLGSTGSMIGLTFDTSGTLFGAGCISCNSGSTDSLFTIDLASGTPTSVGEIGYFASGDLAFDPNGNLFLSAVNFANFDDLVAVDPSSGAGSLIGSIGFAAVYGLNFAGSSLYGFTLEGSTISIDTTSGLGTEIALNNIGAYGADGVGGVAGAIPESSTLALLGLGMAGFGAYRRKEKHSPHRA